jgi:hypothetical protein
VPRLPRWLSRHEGEQVDERDAFLQAMLPRLISADTALHNGDAGPRLTTMWSHNSQ